jgi:hypothetical protein
MGYGDVNLVSREKQAVFTVLLGTWIVEHHDKQ